MNTQENTIPSIETNAARQDAKAPDQQLAQRPWVRPVFERVTLNEALTGVGGLIPDGPASS